ncbi:hypothetical protein Dda_1610 [Drechslerella dactyloides]|uniref:Uncharacterized protein n=1 Tax=Drechslerella dactyloides TaxID=74499 RepID=A0AAD6NKS7_DREDA|nr:hypothetical protein Dda_1610 [Drechslerella dactyloides]
MDRPTNNSIRSPRSDQMEDIEMVVESVERVLTTQDAGSVEFVLSSEAAIYNVAHILQQQLGVRLENDRIHQHSQPPAQPPSGSATPSHAHRSLPPRGTVFGSRREGGAPTESPAVPSVESSEPSIKQEEEDEDSLWLESGEEFEEEHEEESNEDFGSPDDNEEDLLNDSTDSDSDATRDSASLYSPESTHDGQPQLTHVGNVPLTVNQSAGAERHYYPDWMPPADPSLKGSESFGQRKMRRDWNRRVTSGGVHSSQPYVAKDDPLERLETLADMAIAMSMAENGDAQMAYVLDGIRKYSSDSREFAECNHYLAQVDYQQVVLGNTEDGFDSPNYVPRISRR